MTATIAARPFDFALDPSRAALVVIDMQRDFLEPGGFGESLGNDVSRLRAIVPATARLIAGFRSAGLPVIHTRECHRPDLSDCPPAKRLRGAPGLRIGDRGPMGRILVAGEPGVEIVHALSPLPGELVIDKPGKGAFHATALEERLKTLGVRQLVFAGVTTEVCVQTTMREANDRGYECLLAEDATESYFPQFKQAAIEMITAQGAIVGWTASVEAILSGLSGLPSGAAGGVTANRRGNDIAMPQVFHGLLGLDLADTSFEPFRDGVEIAHLHRPTVPKGPALALLRYASGASVPLHEHTGLETICVLSGSQADDNGLYRAGDVVTNEARTRHRVWSDEGCLVLIFWAAPVRLMDDADGPPAP